jgi:hypothetical protein
MFLIASLLLPAGCDDPVHENRLRMRRENIAYDFELLRQAEAPREENLARLREMARRQNRKDIAATRENPHIIAREIQGEFDRFRDRQPSYRREIENQLRGDPENIRRTIPYMLY